MGHNKKIAAFRLGDVRFYLDEDDIPAAVITKRDVYDYQKKLKELSQVSDIYHDYILALTWVKVNDVLDDLENKVLGLSILPTKKSSSQLVKGKAKLNMHVNHCLREFKGVSVDWNRCLSFYSAARSIERTNLSMDVSLLRELDNACQEPNKRGHRRVRSRSVGFTAMRKLQITSPSLKLYVRSNSLIGVDKPRFFRSTLQRRCQHDPLFCRLARDNVFSGVNQRLISVATTVDQKFGLLLVALQKLTDNNYFDRDLFVGRVFNDFNDSSD